MRMDDLRLPARQRAINPPERPQIVQRRNWPDELADVTVFRRSKRQQRRHVSFAVSEMPVNQVRLEAFPPKLAAEIDRLNGWAADVQARDDARHSVVGSRHAGAVA